MQIKDQLQQAETFLTHCSYACNLGAFAKSLRQGKSAERAQKHR